jgi:hypothetical protein
MAGGTLAFQTDGNLVAYKSNNRGPYWSSGTSGPANSGVNYILIMQDDGNLCIYNTSNRPFTLIWKSGSNPTPFPKSTGQTYNEIKNKAIQNLNTVLANKTLNDKKIRDYLDIPNDNFDPNNALNSENALFGILLHKNLINCNNKPLDDMFCSSYYTNANKNINNMIANAYLTR